MRNLFKSKFIVNISFWLIFLLSSIFFSKIGDLGETINYGIGESYESRGLLKNYINPTLNTIEIIVMIIFSISVLLYLRFIIYNKNLKEKHKN